jgi:uncharacterized protein (TIGR02145 family)
MVAVGYGREAEDGSQTLGGRSVDELSANITTISQELNTDATTIIHMWTRSANAGNKAYYLYLNQDKTSQDRFKEFSRGLGLSVRCIKDI